MPRGTMTARLLRNRWERSDWPFDEVGECTDISGCSRAGRWTHPHVQGLYCAQHANQACDYRGWN